VAETRSPDSPLGQRDRNGYDPTDGFAVPDESFDLSLSSSPSTDDDSATSHSSDDNSRADTSQDRAARMEIIALAMQRAQSKSGSKPPFQPTAPTAELAILRAADVHVKRRVSHLTPMVELLLNAWLRNDTGVVEVAHVAEFLRLLRQHQLEYAKSIYFVLCKRIRPVSFPLFKFLYFCISRYLPMHKTTILDAYRDVLTKLKLFPEITNTASARSSAPPRSTVEWKAKPTSRPPTIPAITDIAYAVGKFHDEYKAYKREHESAHCHFKTVFQCLSCDQQSAFAATTMMSDTVLDSMDDQAFFELWRTTFGLRSSASVLQAVRSLCFAGDPLIPSSWTEHYRIFERLVAQAPLVLTPPSKVLARSFVSACPDAFLRNDVLANEPESVRAALQLIISRLNDSGFLRSALAYANANRAERAHLPANAQAHGSPFSTRRLDGNGYGPSGGTAVVSTRHSGSHDQRPRENPRPAHTLTRDSRSGSAQPQPLLAKEPPRPTPAAVCKRCRKSGHTENACISKHDVDGNKLERQDAEVYAKRKEQARLETAARIKIQAVCDATDSDTEDVDAECNNIAVITMDDDASHQDFDVLTGVLSISEISVGQKSAAPTPAVKIVPAPSLLLCGDIEPNPGPPVFKRKRSGKHPGPHHVSHCNLETTAIVLSNSTRPISQLRRNPSTPVNPALGLISLIVFLVLWRFARIKTQRAAAIKVQSLDASQYAVYGDGVNPDQFIYYVCARPATWCSRYDSCVPPPSLLMDGDVEPNPGPFTATSPMTSTVQDCDATFDSADDAPHQRSVSRIAVAKHQPSVFLSPSSRRRPVKSIPRSFFSPPLPQTVSPTAPSAVSPDPDSPLPTPNMALNSSSSDIDRDNTPASVVPWSTIQAVFGASSDSDTSDVDEAPAIPSIASTLPIDGLLLPPKFNAFIVPVGTTNPPPKSSAQVCAIDTMCQGQYSVVSKELADRLNLPRKPCDISARTASGAIVTCTSLATFAVTVFILGTWISLPTQALVWKTTAEPILLSNSFALTTGLIEFVKPNDERVPLFGRAAFALYWKQAIASHETSILAAYHEDVMPEEADDFIDLDAPLRCGDQDVSALPPDALAYAQKYPEMTRAIPRDAHPSLDRWEAHVQEDKIPLYSWPKVELKDLKEEPLPFAYTPLLHKEFDKLKAMHYAEEVTSCPTAVAMRAQLVSKSKTEKRFCVNGSTQKNILAVASYPMPHIRQIFAFVSSFPYRAKIDLKHGYHNFEIHPESRKWTVTIGAGRAIQWRKLVQGFAPSGAFFQYAMCRLLGPNVVWKIAAVYLDDIIVVGKTKDECATNVATIMARLASVKFRINFSKCVFTPSENIDFLGCRLEGVLVHPGPKVSTMLSRIRSPHEQHTPKAQRHHLHVFLGMCAFIMQHCPGLKQALAPLYIAVASDPYHYGDLEKAAFTKAMAMLAHLQPFFLPSHDPEVTVEVMTDASGGVGTPADPGSWAIVLGQRKGPFNPDDIASGFELLQSDGGVFNARQSLWDILKKEASALFQAFWRFRAFLYGRRVRIITDSKVLIFMFRSEIPMIKRWHAFIQTFDYVMVHVSSERNALADALTRCIHIAPQTLPTGSRLLSFAAVDIPAPSLLRDGDVEPNPGPVSDVIVIPDSDDEALVVAPVTEPSPRTEYSLTPQSRRRQRQRRPAPGPTSAQTEAVNDDVSTAQPQAPSIPRERQRARQGPSPPEAIPAAMPENERDFKAGIDPRWPIHETALRIHRTDPSTSALCTAFSDSLRYEQVSSQRGRLVNEPPFRPLDVRERTLWFMAEYPNTVVDSRIGLSTRSLFNSSLLANALHLAFDHTEDRHSPTSWSEYQTLMADDGTYPDIIFIHAAARLYRCQIVMFIENDDEVPYIVIAPPHAFRRIFLFASSSLQRVNWAYPTTDETSVDVADATFHAPLLAPPPTQFEVNDEALHSLYNRLPVNDERLRQIHLAHNGYSGHSGVERTVRSLVSVGSKWRGMTADVAQFIRRCPTCCASRLKLQYAPVSASSLRLSARPLSRWHLDQTGSMPACAFTGYTRFIAFICETTQFIMLFGSRFGTALEIAIALIQLIGFFDLPEAIHSDHGSENENYIWHQVQQITGIKRTFSMPYVPQTNGIAERAIGSAKQFIRNLSIDVGRHNSWGLLLPIAQKGLNSLPREELMWYSPSQVIFASCHTPDHFAIPTFYSRAMREIDFANAHAYHVSGNFGHRAMIFQQHVFNHFHALRERALDEAAAREPSALQDLQVGQAVLVDWPSGGPPSPLHPCKQGPFRVAEIRRNVVVLQHIETPPPDKQPSILQWSKQAHVYMYPHAHVPDRSASDPSAAMSPLGQTRRQIECVISHRPLRGSQARQPRTAHQRHHVQNFEYTCRLFAADLPDAAIPHMLRVFTYEDIQHTYAFDCYVLAHRSLEGHVPISHMPSTFQPQAVARSLRPSHDPCPSHEHFTHHSGNSSDTSDIDSVNDDHAQTPNSA
jgi:transposase InsO family protein